MCVFQISALKMLSDFSSEKARFGRSELSFYFIRIFFYIDIAFSTTFPPRPHPHPHSPLFNKHDSTLLTGHN